MSEELKPCPFCGGLVSEWVDLGKHWVQCTTPNCRVGFIYSFVNGTNPTDSLWWWNRRTPDYKALAQELATALLRYEKKLRYTSDEMDMDAVDVLLKARAAGLEVP
jgi:hypothetical protein